MRQPAPPAKHAHPSQDDPGAASRGVALGVLIVLALCVGIIAALLMLPGGVQ